MKKRENIGKIIGKNKNNTYLIEMEMINNINQQQQQQQSPRGDSPGIA